ncbi:MAG TPA: lysophospholipid acyltransferase family protein [Phycisphaerales bacterium]|nr:lysophospholipid acyltransferase family protein [Phycisphaerales bacterium]HMP37301.1 lysophospholipid acyltransferase family protein [Phycisphaerales bacterium]
MSIVAELLQYLPLRALAAAMHMFPPRPNLRTAGLAADCCARAWPRRIARSIENLRIAFPEWTDARRAEVAAESLRHWFRFAAVDVLATPRRVTPLAWPRHVGIGDISRGLEPLLAARPTIFITGHFGNWELLGYTLATIGFPLHAVARPLDNRYLNRWVLGVREARGMRIITKWGATPILQAALERGGAVGFIADQNAGDDGIFVPFFGRLASHYKAIGLLAMRYETPIVTGCALRTGHDLRCRLEVTDVIEPSEWTDAPDPLFLITARYARAMEAMVRLAPEQYLWLHRRWKSRPRFERDGRALPAAMRRKLESLPWMTDEAIRRIERDSAGSAAAT